MRKLAIDLGSKRIGLAVSDPLDITAQPIGYIKRSDLKTEADQISAFIEEFDVSELIVGLPLDMIGTFGEQAKKAHAYADLLKQELKIPVKTWDERLTTKQAEDMLIKAGVSRKKRKEVIDSLAAVIILQNYLDTTRK